MKTSSGRVFSDLAIPPGEVLGEELEARGMTQREFAARLGRPAQAVNEIIRGRKAITPDTAIGISRVLGIEAGFWTALEARYRTVLAREREREALVAQLQWLEDYPVLEMVKRGWIAAGADGLDRLEALLGFLGVASIEPRVYQEAVGFRITDAARSKVSPGALSAWLRMGELEARGIDVADYSEASFREALTVIRGMTEQPPEEFMPAMSRLCSDAGVAFCVIRELPKSGANGVARWLADGKALIQMSIRSRWADIFWFSFFHESCHLLEHRSQGRILIEGIEGGSGIHEMEIEADRFARDFLIPSGDWSDFCGGRDFTASSVEGFARSAGIAPFIVVGRLQKEGLVSYDRLVGMKRRYLWDAG